MNKFLWNELWAKWHSQFEFMNLYWFDIDEEIYDILYRRYENRDFNNFVSIKNKRIFLVNKIKIYKENVNEL